MKTRMIKGLTMVGIAAMVFGATAALPALADGRPDDNCGRPDIRVIYNTGDRYFGHDNDRRDRDDHRGDKGRFDRRDDRR